MKTTLYTIFILSVFIFSACNNKAENKKTDKPVTAKDLHVKLRDDYKYVNFIPDSLLTTEQRLLCIKLGKICTENMEFVNNRFILNLTREDLIKDGIPEPYFETLQNNIIDINFFLDTNKEEGEHLIKSFTPEQKALQIAECQHLIDSLQNIINKK